MTNSQREPSPGQIFLQPPAGMLNLLQTGADAGLCADGVCQLPAATADERQTPSSDTVR